MATKTIKTKAELIAAIAEKAEITKAQAKTAIEELVQLAYVGAKKDKDGFTIPGLGKISVVQRKARMGRNPKTKEAIEIPASRAPVFKPSKALKDSLAK